MIAKQKSTKYGSSPSLAGIEDVIAFFYAGERKQLFAMGDKLWTVHRADGSQIAGVCVRFVKGRYVFEAENEGLVAGHQGRK